MRVTIEPLNQIQYEKQGWFRTKVETEEGNFLRVLVEVTDEERAVLDKQALWNHVLYEKPNPNYEQQLQFFKQKWAQYEEDKNSHIEMVRWTARSPADPEPSKSIQTTISQFCAPRGRTLRFSTIGEAKNHAEELRTKILPLLKDTVDHDKTPIQKQTFDF